MNTRINGTDAPALLLELIARKESRCAALRKRAAEHQKREVALTKQMATLRSKACTQKELLDAA